ncbi:MAG TPA: carbohydrate ABC transporter permease [Thermomicrobiales bacterium]|nr:carbohydrate ABC transporter permease [Thermomicrobiales bacterium]
MVASNPTVTTTTEGRLASAIAIPDTRTQRHKRRIKWGTVGRHAVLMFFSLSVLLPLTWVVMRSVISLPDGTHNNLWPQNWADPWYQHYDWILKRRPEIRTNFRNSVYVSLLTVFTTTITAVLAGYALVHLRTPFKRVLTAVLVASLFFPTRVTAITGIFEVQRELGFINKTWTLVFPYTALNVAICIFIMRGVFETVSKEILDAARIDGAGSLRLLLGILLPIIKNGVVVVIIVSFVAAWGEFLLALTLMNDGSKRTLPVFIATASGGVGGLLWPRIAAVYIMAILPGLIVFAFAQRWYTKGLQEGALKA